MSRPIPMTTLAVLLHAVAAVGCRQDCRPGYEQQKDGSCLGEAIVGQASWDTGTLPDSFVFYEATVNGEVRPGNVDLASAGSIILELWTSQNTTLYGPDRQGAVPDQSWELDLEALQTGESVVFSETHSGIPLRGREVFLYAAVYPTGSGPGRFFEAAANPYTLYQDQDSEPIEIVIDTTTEGE